MRDALFITRKRKLRFGAIFLNPHYLPLRYQPKQHFFRLNKEEILILVGGWNGKKRSNSVHAFDLKDEKWIGLKEWTGGRHRVPPPVGLSSHTATAINDKLVCVLGREGGIKTQRRFGDLFLLNLDLGNIYNSFI
jgi:hypothetical protein